MSEVAGLSVQGGVLVVGGGVMGEAIVRGWLESGVLESSDITVAEPSSHRREQLVGLGVSLLTDASEGLPAGLVMLAVKPQIMESVVSSLSASMRGALVVSIAAGISCAKLESLLPAGSAVVRVMPNTPAMVGEGMSLVSAGSEASEDQVTLVRELFASIGKAVVIEERYQNAGTAISGSGPAYFALVVEALARAGVSAGLTRQLAESLAVQTMRGTATLLETTGKHPAELIDGVSSPGGTTIAALSELEAGGLRAAFNEAVRSAVRRAEELG